MSHVTIFSNQTMMCQQKLAESAKSAGDDLAYMLCQQNVPTQQ